MINVAIMGYGTIGSGVFEMISINQDIIKSRIGDDIRVKKILDLRNFPDTPVEDLIVHDITEITEDDEIDIVVETMGGTNPAFAFIKQCLLKGKHATTSNKALVAAHGTELLEIARKNNVNFMFEASVGGGIPVIRAMSDSYSGEIIEEITGIMNGTTNYILTKMDEEGGDFADALKEAQDLGYAERNPDADIEGHDTCRKVAILASLATGKEVSYEDIYTEGITKIDKIDFEYAQKMGTSIKLLGSAIMEDENLLAYVCPVMIGKPHPLFSVRDVYNGIMIRGNMIGETMLYGSGAGKFPTASAVIADIIAIAKNKEANVKFGWGREKLVPVIMDKTSHRYFIRFKGKTLESVEKAERAFGLSRVFYLDGKDEFALLTGYMREKDYLTVSKGLDGIIKMIRAEMGK